MPQTDFWPFSRCKGLETMPDGNPQSSKLVRIEESNRNTKQIRDMEGEVKDIQMELETIKQDRIDLFNMKHKRASENDILFTDFAEDKNCNKEISKLREELIRAKNCADEEKLKREKYEGKLRDLERKLNSLCSPAIITEGAVTNVPNEYRQKDADQVSVMKSQLRDMSEEMEELKLTLSEKNEQLQEYRLKYLQAQQQVEELKRQLDVIEFDNKQVSDQIQIEIQKMKMQFQEKLQELSPLPDLLKGAQIQVQEAKQMQKLAEDSSEQLSLELQRVKEKLVTSIGNLNQEKACNTKLTEDNKILKFSLDERQKEIEELYSNIDDYKSQVLRFQEKLTQMELRYSEKASECHQVTKALDELRVESNRSLSRVKERSDATRRYLQTQISELERQLIQSRAQHRACQKERDEMRQRFQIQLSSLQENFEMVELRLRGLQNQVASIKTNYSILLADEEEHISDYATIQKA